MKHFATTTTTFLAALENVFGCKAERIGQDTKAVDEAWFRLHEKWFLGRVARWYYSNQNSHFWYFVRPSTGKVWYFYVWPFGIFNEHLVYVVWSLWSFFMSSESVARFFWNYLPKRETLPNDQKYTKRPKIYQMTIKYMYIPNRHTKYHNFQLYVMPSKVYQNGNFGHSNVPSGNPM
jgi:hypothetical protein